MDTHRISIVAGVLLFLFPGDIPSQTVFERTFGGVDADYGNDVRQTSDGGYILTGTTHSFGEGEGDVYLIRTDPVGDTIWTRTFGGPGVDEGKSVRETMDGGYALLAGTYVPGGGANTFLIKTDLSGSLLWMKTYEGESGTGGTAIEQTADSGFIITGISPAFNVLALRLTSLGDTLWARTFDGPGFFGDGGVSVRETRDGGFIIGGWSDISDNRTVGYVIRTDKSGDTLWTRIYPDPCVGVEQLPDGGFVLGGAPHTLWGTFASTMTRTDSVGNTLWSRRYAGLSPSSLMLTLDGGYILSGQTSSPGTAVLLKTDASGDSLWMQTFSGESTATGASAEQTADGGYVLVGTTSSFGEESDVYLVKTTPDGTTDIQNRAAIEFPRGFGLAQNYPNPFNPSTTIVYALPGSAQVRLEVFNVLGERVRILTDGLRDAGYHSVRFDGDGQPSGIYFYRLQATSANGLRLDSSGGKKGDFVETRKFLLLR